MNRTVNARISPHLKQKLAVADATSAWTLAADLIPERGTQGIQSKDARKLTRKAIHRTRAG